jgi:hypothetical protein
MSNDQTRVLSTAGETIATYGPEFYAGHVATIVYELNPHLRVQSTEDGGKTWSDVTERTTP